MTENAHLHSRVQAKDREIARKVYIADLENIIFDYVDCCRMRKVRGRSKRLDMS